MKVFVKVNKQGNIESIDIERIESFYDAEDLKAIEESQKGKNIKSLKHVDLPVTHRIYQRKSNNNNELQFIKTELRKRRLKQLGKQIKHANAILSNNNNNNQKSEA